MTEHIWFQDNLAANLAGGLSTEEDERFGRHRVACGACAKILADAQSFDGAMEKGFNNAEKALLHWIEEQVPKIK